MQEPIPTAPQIPEKKVKELRIVVTDVDSGKVLVDINSRLAIVSLLDEVTNQKPLVRTWHIGNPDELAVLLARTNESVVLFLNKVYNFGLSIVKGIKPYES